MKSAKMPWIGLKWNSKAATALQKLTKRKKSAREKGMPCLTLLDGNDKVLADSYDGNGEYLGPSWAMRVYEKLHEAK